MTKAYVIKKLDTKIKTKIKLARNFLFQIRYNKVDHSRVSKIPARNCVLQTFTALGLRDPILSEKDSNIMVKKNCHGMRSSQMSKYLSIIFKTNIITQFKNIQGKNKYDKIKKIYRFIKNGYATIICVEYLKLNGKTTHGAHCFVLYKENGIIKFYDPPTQLVTSDINEIMKKYRITHVVGSCIFYNEGMDSNMLTNNTHPFEINKDELIIK